MEPPAASRNLPVATATSRRKPRNRRMPTFEAAPYPWPYNGEGRPQQTPLQLIDMQTDFCGKGGYVDSMGYDLSLTQAPIGPIKALLAAARPKGYHIFPTRASHRPG